MKVEVNMFGQTFKIFSVNFVSPNSALSFFSGDVVSGEMRFELSKDINIQYISMTLKGSANVMWTTRSGSGKRRRTTTHSAKLKFFKLESNVVQGQNGRLSANLM